MMNKTTAPDESILARRTLYDARDSSEVEIELHRPELDSADAHGDWKCKVSVCRANGDMMVTYGYGVDSLQALINAIAALRSELKNIATKLRWLGDDGVLGLPLMVQEDDPDMVALLENLIDAEYGRQLLWKKRLKNIRS